MSIQKKLNTIKKYNSSILDLQDKIKCVEIELFNDIKLLLLQTNFVEIKYENGKKDFIYTMKIFDSDNKWYISGIKCDNKKNIEIGCIEIEHIEKCKDIKSIEPIIFFNVVKKLNINWQANDITQACLKNKPIDISDNDMLPSVGYCRLSKKYGTYDRQQYNISNQSTKNGYKVNKFFCETLSGDTPFNKRDGILELIEYCSMYDIHKLYVSEFNRLGRTTKTILDGISFLRKNGIQIIHVVLENIIIDEDYIKNNYRELKHLCKKSEEDRENIVNRMHMGLMAYKEKLKNGENVKPLGRTVGFRYDENHYKEKYHKEIELLLQGVSQRQIETITGTSQSTIKRLNKMFKCNCKQK